MNNFRKSASDSNYHSRHARRTLQRAARIAENIERPARILDVGCNNGITSQFMLDNGVASHVTGIELHATTVDEALMSNPNFNLVEGNIVDLEIDKRFGAIIYGAVHHHILNFHGLDAAVGVLRKLVAQCDGSLFFETGQIGEGGRWRWQRKMRRYFRTDEEHFFYLLRCIEDQIEGFEVIGQFWIHNVRRSYLRIDVNQSKADFDASGEIAAIDWPADVTGPFVRTFGSREQILEHESNSDSDDSPACFWTSGEQNGLFIKRHRHHPIAASQEISIGSQVQDDWATTPLGVTKDPDAIAFRRLQDAVPIAALSSAPEQVRRNVASQILEIFTDAAETRVTVDNYVLLPTVADARLIDICDLNPNNFLVRRDGGTDFVCVVDFEQQGSHYAYRNRMHLSKMLFALKTYRIRAMSSYASGLLAGIGWLLRYISVPFAIRVRDRQPNLVSLVVADFRSAVGRLAGALLTLVGLGEK